MKILAEGDVLDRAQVGNCPAFHTVTTGSRSNIVPESLAGEFTYPVSGEPTLEIYNETNQPYAWPGDRGWFDIDSGIPTTLCARPLTTEDGAYSIVVTPFDGELQAGEPAGDPAIGLTIHFSIETDPISATRIEVYNTDLPPDQGFVKILVEGDVLDRADVGSCPAFHTVTTGPRNNSSPESLRGKFVHPGGVEYYYESSQPYAWPGDQEWFNQDAGIPKCLCRDDLTVEDGDYSIIITPYDGELVGGEPTGNAGQGLTVNFYVPEPSRWVLLVAGLGCLGVLDRVRGR